jgi:uncharacterized protein YdgA (DUF945 family)
MKRAFGALAVLVLLYPVVAWLMGFAIEHRVESLAYQGQLMVPQLHLLQKTQHGVLTSDEGSSYEVGSTLKITRHYHRGWYRSVDEATVEMSIAALAALPGLKPADATSLTARAGQAPLRFLLRTVIFHGPLCGAKCFALAGAETHISFTGPLQASLTRLFGNREPVTIRGRFAFFGGGTTEVSSPAFEHAQLAQDVLLSWGGIDGTMHYGAAQDWYDLTASAPVLRLESAKGTLEIDRMSLGMRAKRALRTLYEGDSRVQLQHVTVTGADKAQLFTIDDLLFASKNHVEDRFMSASYQWDTGAVRTPPLTLTGAHVDITWKHLGIEALESLTAAMRSPGQDQNTPGAPAARAQQLMAALKQPFEALLLDQPEMELDRVSLASAQGQGLVTGSIRLPGVSSADFETPALLVPKIDVRLDFAIDEAFLASLPGAGANALTQLQPMIDQGFITRSNGALRTQLLVRGGQATLNGKPFNPAALAHTAPPGPGGTSPQGTPAPPGSPVPRRRRTSPRRAGTVL